MDSVTDTWWEHVAILTSYARIVGDSDAAEIVEGDGRHLARTSGPVFVVAVVPRHRVVVIVINIGAGVLVLQQRDPQVNELQGMTKEAVLDYYKAVVFSRGYAKTSCINQNETQEPIEPETSSNPRTHEDSSPN
jgi:hypothetical protein